MLDRRSQAPDRRRVPRGGRRSTDPPPDWLSVADYAHVYGIDRSTVYKWLAANILETYRSPIGSVVRIRHLPPDQHRPSYGNPD